MDCSSVRQWLDLHPLVSVTGTSGDAANVREHLTECVACREFAQETHEFDERLSVALTDVTIPDGLRERLVQQLQKSAPSAKTASVPFGRRWGQWAGVCTTLVLLIGIGFWATRPSPLTLDQVGDSAAELLLGGKSQPVAFDGRFIAEVEDPRWQRAIASNPVGWDLDGRPGHDVAAFRISISPLRLRGWLVVIPVSRVRNPPEGSDPIRLRYSQSIGWRDQKFVYVCLAEQGNIESLLDQWNAA